MTNKIVDTVKYDINLELEDISATLSTINSQKRQILGFWMAVIHMIIYLQLSSSAQ